MYSFYTVFFSAFQALVLNLKKKISYPIGLASSFDPLIIKCKPFRDRSPHNLKDQSHKSPLNTLNIRPTYRFLCISYKG